jgi:hypothetical protein
MQRVRLQDLHRGKKTIRYKKNNDAKVGLLMTVPAEMVRVNTRVSKPMNEWLDKESAETGIPKSTIIFLALENYKREKDVMGAMGDMGSIMQKLEELQKAVEQK